MRKEKITRHKAEEWLGATLHNRTMRPRYIQMYAQDMMDGKWDSDIAPPILIDQDTGGVLNGQHRLRAFLTTTLEVFESYVHYAPREAISMIDCGPARNLIDTLDIRGHELSTYKSAWLNRAVQWVAGDRPFRLLTRDEQVKVIEESPNIEKAAIVAKHLNDMRSKVVRVPMGTSAVMWDILEYSYGGDFVIDFIERLQKSEDLTRPMARLQSRMLEAANTRSKFALGADALSYLIARVLTATLNEEDLTKMYARRAAIKDIPGYKEWVEATFDKKFS